jgi:hypothetical protein
MHENFSLLDRLALVEVHANDDSLKIYVDGEKDYYRPRGIMVLERSREPVRLTVVSDTLRNEILLKSRAPIAHWLINRFWGLAPITYAWNWHPASRVYPGHIYIHFNNATGQVRWQNWIPASKGQQDLEISFIGGCNYLFMNQGTDYGHEYTWRGISAGRRRYFNDRNSIGLRIGTVSEADPYFIFWDVDSSEMYNWSGGSFIDVFIGKDIGRVVLDIGFQTTRTFHESWEPGKRYDTSGNSDHEQRNLGISLAAGYRLSEELGLRLCYYPSFVAIHGGNWSFHYSHLLRLEMVAKKMIRPRGKRAAWRPPSMRE